MKQTLSYSLWQAVIILLLAAAYVAAAKFGFVFSTVAEQVTLIWPPTGIALAALMIMGRGVWPGIFIGAFIANLTSHVPVLPALAIAAGNTLEAVAGLWLLRRYAGSVLYFARVRDVLGLVFFAATLSTTISATAGVLSLTFSGLQPWPHFSALWVTWWLGDAGGDLLVAPFLVVWSRRPVRTLTRVQILEACLLTLVTVLFTFVLFVQPEIMGGVPVYPYMILPVVIWAAISFGQRGATLANLFIFSVAVWGVEHHVGIFSDMPRGAGFDAVQIFAIITAAAGLVVSAAVREGEEAVQSDRFLASLVDSTEECIIGKTLEGVISSWNRGAEKLFGYTAQEAIGRKINIIIPPDREEEEKNIIATISRGQRVHLETVRRSKTGERLYVILNVSPIFDSKGKIVGASKIGHDITARVFAEKNLQEIHEEQQKLIQQMKDKEEQLVQYTHELKISNQELDDFAYIASHDLKEPLRGLLTQTTFLLEDYQDKLDIDGARRLRRLTYLATRMEKLISDLLYFSRLGRVTLAVQKTDLNAVIVEIRHMMETFLKERNAQIIVPEVLPEIVCDKLRVAEVFRNLITNAIKYNDKPDPRIEVGYTPSIRAPHGMEKDVFYVKDNGIGIPKEFYDDIFRIFKRLDHPSIQPQEGTGSGLTFVKKIVERHNGHIWIESELGKGSTFYFTIGRKT